MNKFWKKLVSGFMTVVMLVSVFPVAVFAETAETDWDTAASVGSTSAVETPVYVKDGSRSDPIGSAQMEMASRFIIQPEKTVEHVHEETVVDDNGIETVEQHVHVEKPYHDWRAAMVVSFDRAVERNTIGIATRCDNCNDGGISGWHGFLVGSDLGTNSVLQLKGSFASSLAYGKLCETVREIYCGAFNLSENNIGTKMTVSLRLYEKENGVETGSWVTLASYSHVFKKTASFQSVGQSNEIDTGMVTGEASPSEGNVSQTEEFEAVPQETDEAGDADGDVEPADDAHENEEAVSEDGNSSAENGTQTEHIDVAGSSSGSSDTTDTDSEQDMHSDLNETSEDPDEQTNGDEDTAVEDEPQSGDPENESSGAGQEVNTQLPREQGQNPEGESAPAEDSNLDSDGPEQDILKDTESANVDPERGEQLTRGSAEGEETDGERSNETWIVTITSRTRTSSANVCRLTGGGQYGDGETVTVTAFPRKGYHFIGWFDAADSEFSTILSNQQSYEFTVSEDTSLIALFEVSQGTLFTLTVHGSKYKVNNGSIQSDMATFTYNVGERMYISFCDDSKEFLYWVNASGNILSTQRDFSFVLASDAEISSYYERLDTGDTKAMVVFRNAFQQVLLSRSYAAGETISYPANDPIKMSYIFTGWYIADENGEPTSIEATPEAIYAAMEGANAVVVVPNYVESGKEYTITLEYTDGSSSIKEGKTVNMGVGDAKKFTAPSIDGYTFQYWMLNGVKASYSTSYTVICALPGTALLQAVYGSGEASQEPTVLITQTYSRQEESKYIIANTLQYFAPEGYTIMEVGFVYGVDSGIFGIAGGADSLYLDAPGTKKHISGQTTNEGIYTFNARTTDPNKTMYAKAYLICKAPDGTIVTLYSDMTAGSYNSLSEPGGLTIVVVNSDTSVLDATASVPDNTSIKDEVIVNSIATLTIFISDAAANAEFDDQTEAAKGYDVRIEGIKDDNTALLVVNMERALPSGLSSESVKAYHAGASMARAESKNDLNVEDEFYYDSSTGDVSIAVSHFSNYTFVYPREVFPITYLDIDGITNIDALPTSYTAGIALNLVDAERDGYTFEGWYERNIRIETITADRTGPITLTASWSGNQYTIRFVNHDGTELQSSDVTYGGLPAYEGETPTKEEDAQFTYTFAGWDPEIAEVTGPATYTATFTGTVKKYTIRFVNYDGTELQSSEIAYGNTPVYSGKTPTKEEDAQYIYTFAGWAPDITAVIGEATYTATFTPVLILYTSTWNWSDDFTTAIATFTSTNGGSATYTVTATGEAITSSVTTAATCVATGLRTYTATVTFEGTTYTNETTVEIPIDANAHDWAEITYTWSDDNSTVTALKACNNRPRHYRDGQHDERSDGSSDLRGGRQHEVHGDVHQC